MNLRGNVIPLAQEPLRTFCNKPDTVSKPTAKHAKANLILTGTRNLNTIGYGVALTGRGGGVQRGVSIFRPFVDVAVQLSDL